MRATPAMVPILRKSRGVTLRSRNPPQITAGTPLNTHEIRILVLFPSNTHDSPLEGRYERQELSSLGESIVESDSRSYEAISYIWGSNRYETSMLVDGRKIQITWNLHLALQDLRQKERERRVWVDCVCINMDDLDERAQMILNMRCIFQGARQVLVWLGPVSEQQSMALPFLKAVTKAADVDDVLRGNNSAAGWDSVRQLLLQPYFTRVWVVQEIAVARRAILFANSESIDWRTFAAAIAIFDKRCLLYPAELVGYDEVQIRGASRFVRTVLKSFRRDEYGNAKEPMLSLEQLVFELAGSHASDPRDKIYALLSIAADIDLDRPKITPDYTNSLSDLYLKFYQFCLRSTKEFDVILRPWGQQHHLPPWIHEPNDSELATSLVRPPGEVHLSLVSVPADTYPHVNDVGVLKVYGYEFDWISSMSAPHNNLDLPLPRSWLEIVPATQLVEALLSESWPKYNAFRVELTACLHQAFEGSSNVEGFSAILSQYPHLNPAFKHIKTLAQGRRLIQSGALGLVGLAPIGAKPDDLLCLVLNCSVPIVLRKTDSSLIHDQGHALIGACFLHGVMKIGLSSDRHRRFEILPAAMCQGFEVPVYDDDELSMASTSSGLELGMSAEHKDLVDTLPADRVHPKASFAHSVRDVTCKGFRLRWTCACGHKGMDHYIEHSPGSVKNLMMQLRDNGMRVSMHRWDPFGSFTKALEIAGLRAQLMLENLWRLHIVLPSRRLLRKRLSSRKSSPPQNLKSSQQVTSIKGEPLVYTADDQKIKEKPKLEIPDPFEKVTSAVTRQVIPIVSLTSGLSGSGSTGQQGNTGQAGQPTPQPSPSQPQGATSNMTQGQSGQNPQPQVASGNNTRFNVSPSNDFILLCLRTKKHLQIRHDLRLTAISRDRELFAAFRAAYDTNFSWLHRNLGLKSVQKINFVKFKLLASHEIDNPDYGVPPDTETHYELDPESRERTPAIGNDVLMHRFECDKDEDCLDRDYCYEHIPKRLNGPVDPPNPPDLTTAWGMQLEEGYSNRAIKWLLLGIAVSAISGLTWSIAVKDMQKGVIVATFIATCEAVVVGSFQVLLFLTGI